MVKELLQELRLRRDELVEVRENAYEDWRIDELSKKITKLDELIETLEI